MSRISSSLVICLLAFSIAAAEPIKLHPDNPHYFLYRGKPTILITSAEHYGAVLNLDFDFVPYLDELQEHEFNLTRVFSGSYREVSGSFNIKQNTLAPKPGRFSAPWARSSTPGASDGGNKFDLTKWDPNYFTRLKSFVAEAEKRGVIVEYVFFCTMYGEELWQASPMNARNNINQIGQVARHEVYTMKEPALHQAQENLVRKVVTELKDAPNVYFEICNEPYERRGLISEWNDRIVAVIQEIESAFPHPHLIAQNFNREPAKVDRINPAISILNFHAASAANASENYHHDRPLADDETGGKGIHPVPYRREAWEFMLSGGAVFNHLDFSFTTEHPRGTFALTDEPGGGGPEIRAQLSALKKFLEQFDFIQMKPDHSSVRIVNSATTVTTLSNPGTAYATYLNDRGPCELELTLPEGTYRLDFINPKNGTTMSTRELTASTKSQKITTPNFSEDLALTIRKDKSPGRKE